MWNKNTKEIKEKNEQIELLNEVRKENVETIRNKNDVICRLDSQIRSLKIEKDRLLDNNNKLTNIVDNLTKLLNEKYKSLEYGLVAIQTSPYDSPIVYQRGKKITQDDGHYSDISIYFRNDGLPSVQIEGV